MMQRGFDLAWCLPSTCHLADGEELTGAQVCQSSFILAASPVHQHLLPCQSAYSSMQTRTDRKSVLNTPTVMSISLFKHVDTDTQTEVSLLSTSTCCRFDQLVDACRSRQTDKQGNKQACNGTALWRICTLC